MAFLRKNFAKGILAADINDIVTQMTMTAGHTLPTAAGTFPLTIWDNTTYPDPADALAAGDLEIVTAEYSGTPNVYAIIRAQESTAAVAHSAGNRAALHYTAGMSEDDLIVVASHESTHEVGGSDLVSHDSLTNFVADEHVLHAGVSIIAGDGLSGGGNISASKTLTNSDKGSTAVITHELAFVHSDIALNTTHRTSDGSDHGFIDQDVTTLGTPTFVSVDLTGITDGNLPYMSSGGGGFADSPLSTDGTDLAASGVVQATEFAKTGWPITPGVTLSFDDASKVFTVTDGGLAYYYIQGIKYVLGGNKTVDLDDATPAEGLWYIYFVGATLTASQTPWVIEDEDKAMVSILYWDNSNNKETTLTYELHNFIMDGSAHQRLHDGGGAAWTSGLLVSDAGSELINVSAGEFHDEDIHIDISDGAGAGLFEQVLSPAELPVYYRDGASAWRIYEKADKKVATDAGFVSGSNELHYNKLNGTWASAYVGSAKYVAYYVVASSDQTEPVVLIMGQAIYSTLAAAKNEIFSGLSLSGMPFEELVVLARVILKQAGSGTYYTISDIVDLRAFNAQGNVTSPLISDHGGLGGLADDDHAQYLLADGTRALAGAWDMASQIITNINIDSGDIHNDVTHTQWDAAYTHSGLVAGNPHTVTPTELGLVIGTNTQAWDASLDSIAALTYASASFIKVTAEDTYDIRTISETKSDLSLNLVENTALTTWAGTSNIVTVGTIGTGTWEATDVAIAHGGTGQSTAQLAINALTAVAGGTNEHVLTKDTVSGDATWKAVGAGTLGTIFGAWASRSAGTNYLAATDGIVTAYTSLLDLLEGLIGYTNSATPPTVAVAWSITDYGGSRPREYISFPVRKGDYWKVDIVGSGETAVVKWLPIGS